MIVTKRSHPTNPVRAKGDINFHKTNVSRKEWEEATAKQNAKRSKKVYR